MTVLCSFLSSKIVLNNIVWLCSTVYLGPSVEVIFLTTKKNQSIPSGFGNSSIVLIPYKIKIFTKNTTVKPCENFISKGNAFWGTAAGKLRRLCLHKKNDLWLDYTIWQMFCAWIISQTETVLNPLSIKNSFLRKELFLKVF